MSGVPTLLEVLVELTEFIHQSKLERWLKEKKGGGDDDDDGADWQAVAVGVSQLRIYVEGRAIL